MEIHHIFKHMHLGCLCHLCFSESCAAFRLFVGEGSNLSALSGGTERVWRREAGIAFLILSMNSTESH